MPTYIFNQSVRMLIIYVHLYLLLSVKMLQAANNRKGIILHKKKTQSGTHPELDNSTAPLCHPEDSVFSPFFCAFLGMWAVYLASLEL